MKAYNFTDTVRRALALAREESSKLQHDFVGTEHVLLGLLDLGTDPAILILEQCGGNPAGIRVQVLESIRKGRSTIALAELPYTSRAKRALEFTMEAAAELRDAYVGTEHLLLGLIREEKGVAAQVLAHQGVTAQAVLDRIRKRHRAEAAAASEGTAEVAVQGTPVARAAADNVWFLEIDTTSGGAIYEQIIARIEEAVATGRLQPGERLPPVRDLAAELGVAPGTVARAYTALEKRSVLETDGARGTRVAERTAPAQAGVHQSRLAELMRPVVVAGFHLGAAATQLRAALEQAMRDIFRREGDDADKQ